MEQYVNLFRLERSNQGTFGRVIFGDFYCYTAELPWRNNERNISCIPPGEYKTEIRISPKYGKVYWLREVPNRSYILIHPGNWAGDTSKGYRSDVNGCIVLGQKQGVLAGQLAVLNSRITVRRFMRELNEEPFILRIIEAFPGGSK